MITDTTTQALLDECDIIIQKINSLISCADPDTDAMWCLMAAVSEMSGARYEISQSLPTDKPSVESTTGAGRD